MDIDRRRLFNASAAGLAAGALVPSAAHAAAPLPSALGRDATQYGVRPNSSEDQTRALQRAIDESTRLQAPLALPPGTYRTGLLQLPNGAQIVGVHGASRLQLTGGPSLFQSQGSDGVSLINLVIDGGSMPLPKRRGLVHCLQGRDVRILDCEIAASGGAGIWLENIGPPVSCNRLASRQSGSLRRRSVRQITSAGGRVASSRADG